jgi:hypothetical protein
LGLAYIRRQTTFELDARCKFSRIRTADKNGTFRWRQAYHLPRYFGEDHAMALRGKTMTKAPGPEEAAEELFSQRRKPEVGQFRLQVDRQTKASFTTFEAAEEAGLEIKKGHPVVRVAVYDTVECINRIIELPKT